MSWSDEGLEAAKPEPIREEVLIELYEAGWYNHAAPRLEAPSCEDHPDPELFFRLDADSVREAMATCAACPARHQCHDWAEKSKQRYGIWAGTIRGGAEGQKVKGPALTCKRGHAEWGVRANGRRYCLACNRERIRALNAARKAA